MNIVISTINRRINLLPLTIDSVRKEWKKDIHLMVGGKDESYLIPYHAKGFELHKDLWKVEQKLNHVQRASYGFWRCLTMDTKQGLLRIEDDVVMKPTWRQQIENAIKKIEEENPTVDKYMVSMLRPFEDCVPFPNLSEPTVQMYVYRATMQPIAPNVTPMSNILTYCNTSACYYSKGLLNTRLSEFIERYSVHGRAVFDLALGTYLFKMAIPIFVIVPNVAENIGGLAALSAMGEPENRQQEDYSEWLWE